MFTRSIPYEVAKDIFRGVEFDKHFMPNSKGEPVVVGYSAKVLTTGAEYRCKTLKGLCTTLWKEAGLGAVPVTVGQDDSGKVITAQTPHPAFTRTGDRVNLDHVSVE